MSVSQLSKRTSKMAYRTLSLIWCANLSSVVLFFGLLALSASANEEDGAVIAVDAPEQEHRANVEYKQESFIDPNVEEFIPSKEWQHVKKGQGIPAGLHVRLNLQTGEREAKLLDGDDGKRFLKVNDRHKELLRKFDPSESPWSFKVIVSGQNLTEDTQQVNVIF